jgi:hypothetical protein
MPPQVKADARQMGLKTRMLDLRVVALRVKIYVRMKINLH